MSLPNSSLTRTDWLLEPGRSFINHGSYGACPRVVIERQHELKIQLENSPSNFMNRLYPRLLKGVREQLAEFLHCAPAELALVSNATSGVNAVLRSLSWRPGDEILLSDHGYQACANVVSYLQQKAKVIPRKVNLPFPDFEPSQVVEAVLAALTPRTRLAMLDHLSSPTAVIFPVEKLCQELSHRGVRVLLDGAHAPGMLDLKLTDLAQAGLDYYTGNFHKWCCAPRGSAFLWVRQERQAELVPAVISHGFAGPVEQSRFLQQFDWCGTFDPTAWLVTPDAIDFLKRLEPGGLSALRARCKALLLQARELVANKLPTQQLVGEGLLGQMASLQLPHDVDPQALYLQLYNEFGIDSWLTTWNQTTLLRLSAAPYNCMDDYQKLANALGELL